MHTPESQALFIDFDNVFDSFAPSPTDAHKLSRFLKFFRQRGTLAIKRAYGNWHWNRRASGLNEFRYNEEELRACTFELTQVFGANASNAEGKNHADIALALEAFEAALQYPHIQTFVIVSNDSDFMPLISRLHKFGKHVIGVGSRGSGGQRKVCRYLPKAYDEFFYIDAILSIVEDQPTPIAQTPRISAVVPEKALRDPEPQSGGVEDQGREMLDRALGLFDSSRYPMAAGEFKNELLKLDPDFNQQTFGAATFSKWLSRHEDLVVISYPNGNQPYIQPAKQHCAS